MITKEAKPAPLIKGEKVYELQISSHFRVRYGFYRQRIAIIPGAEINWEEGFFTVWMVFFLWWVAFEYEYNPEYDGSDEMMTTDKDYELRLREHQRREDMNTEKALWADVFTAKIIEDHSVQNAATTADCALEAFKQRF